MCSTAMTQLDHDRRRIQLSALLSQSLTRIVAVIIIINRFVCRGYHLNIECILVDDVPLVLSITA